ncbi:MAG: hypothetical protein GY754_07405 [bacterium]|nr:hypothetical protein [bacterium]
MIQADMFLSYAIGATFASAAFRQVEAMDSSNDANGENKITPFYSKYYVVTLLYFACILTPIGIWGFLQHPQWTTMQVTATIPAWLFCLWGLTNIGMGSLGYWIAVRFIQKGKYYAAHLQWVAGYFLLFFIMLHGWDGLGWQRLLYDAAANNGALWSPGTYLGTAFPASGAGIFLGAIFVLLAVPLSFAVGKWIREGALKDNTVPDNSVPGVLSLALIYTAGGVTVVSLSSAAIASLIIIGISSVLNLIAGFCIGLPLFFALSWFLLFKKGRPFYFIIKQLVLIEE